MEAVSKPRKTFMLTRADRVYGWSLEKPSTAAAFLGPSYPYKHLVHLKLSPQLTHSYVLIVAVKLENQKRHEHAR
jgi:hypothetical protein